MSTTMPMSRFIQNYKPQLEELAQSDGLIILHQRAGQPSFVLETERRAAATQEANGFIADALSAVIGDSALERAFAERLTDTLPWVKFLPEEDRLAFVEESVETLRACAAINRYTAFAELVHDWKNTAEIHSDPQLAQALSVDIDEPVGTLVE